MSFEAMGGLLTSKAWHRSNLIAFSAMDGQTDYASGLVARTVVNTPGIEILIPARSRFSLPMEKGTHFTVASDLFIVRDVAGDVVCRGAMLDAYHLLIEGPCENSLCAERLAIRRAENRTLIGVVEHLDESLLETDLDAAFAARWDWLGRCAIPAALTEKNQRAMARALAAMKGQSMSAEGIIQHRWTTPDRWPHRAMWLWDTAFHAIGWRHVDAAFARDMISAVLSTQRADGFIANMTHPTGTSDMTQPPVLAMAAKLVYDAEPSLEWLAEIYPRLCATIQWNLDNRDSDGAGLLEWHIDGDPHCRSGESGMDNSPRFDAATQLDAPDFNTFAASDCETLAAFARLLGLEEDAERWTAHHARLCEAMNALLWSEEHGLYMDRDVVQGAHTDVLANSGFLPLMCGAPSIEQAQRLFAHLQNPEIFGTALPVPSIAASDTTHYSRDMWRGPVWININWMIGRGLRRYGFNTEADALRNRTLQIMAEQCEKYGTLLEFYDDRCEIDAPLLPRKGSNAPERSPYNQAIHDYGWSGTLLVDWMTELASS